MSAEKIIVALLKADAALLALVPVARIFAGFIPQTAALPALAYTHISSVEHPTISSVEPTIAVTARMQITVVATSYPAQKALLAAVRAACNNQRGQIAGVHTLNVRREGVGPDFTDADTTVFSQSNDFKVTFIEARP